MALRITGSVIGEPITSSSTSATGMWTSQEVAALQKDGIWQLPVTYSLSSSASNVNEGASITITLTTTGLANGAIVPYVITGANVYSNDFSNSSITGNFVIQNGSNVLSFTANSDLLLEGAEALTITAGGASTSVAINDTSSGVPADAQFPYTTLVLHGNGTNNSQNNTFLDSSTNNATITRNGNTTQGTFNPYATTWSNYFDGSGDYLNYAANVNYLLGTGDFTMEVWFNAPSATVPLITSHQIGGMFGISYESDRRVLFSYNASAGASSSYSGIYSTTKVPLNTWTHFAISRNGNSLMIFINGVLENTSNVTGINIGSYGGNKPIRVGAGGDLASYYTGHLSNYRFVKGTGLYTTTFTPSTTPLTAVANTQILTCQSNRFIDNSGNNYTPTNNGNITVKKFSPFNLPSAYSAATYAGSAYFDGTGDYLSLPSAASTYLSNNQFTIETWVYPTATTASQIISRRAVVTARGFFLTYSDIVSKKFSFYAGDTNNASWELTLTSTNTFEPNQWYHLAVTRNASNVFTLWVNGVSQATSTVSFTIGDDSSTLYIGTVDGGSSPFTGYISDLRLVQGSAVYTAAFTPPTTPLTAISGTGLLCNFTNGGIIDNTMINNFETSGDSKVSTAQSKFGGSSMYFDGTGDYIAAPASLDWALGSNCTVEFWAYPTSAPAIARIINNGTSGSAFTDVYYQNGAIGFCNAGYTSNTLTLNTWTHVACVLNSGTSKIYFNGITQALIGSTTGFNLTANAALWVGGISGYSQYYQGYLDDVRITKGYARYTSNFTPPTLTLADT